MGRKAQTNKQSSSDWRVHKFGKIMPALSRKTPCYSPPKAPAHVFNIQIQSIMFYQSENYSNHFISNLLALKFLYICRRLMVDLSRMFCPPAPDVLSIIQISIYHMVIFYIYVTVNRHLSLRIIL